MQQIRVKEESRDWHRKQCNKKPSQKRMDSQWVDSMRRHRLDPNQTGLTEFTCQKIVKWQYPSWTDKREEWKVYVLLESKEAPKGRQYGKKNLNLKGRSNSHKLSPSEMRPGGINDGRRWSVVFMRRWRAWMKATEKQETTWMECRDCKEAFG